MRGLKPRAYNILFHTHTVSGIVISAVLFVIFFAGAISLYKQEMYQWEDPTSRGVVPMAVDYERLIARMDSIKSGVADAHDIRVKMPTEARPVYTLYALVEPDSAQAYFATFLYNPVTDVVADAAEGDTSTVGETLYRLHFLDQIPMLIGRYLAGFVSLFFAFAVITGLLIHWKNIVSKFYAFSFKDVKKQFWTNAHTVFGLIGLPFQLMYAITGAFYMLSLFVLVPTVVVLFKGDDHKLMEMIYPMEAFHAHDHGDEVEGHIHQEVSTLRISDVLTKIQREHKAYTISTLDIVNFGDEHAVLGAELVDASGFNQNGLAVVDLHTGDYKLTIEPGEKGYIQSILNGINLIHFGSFGGWFVKFVYFLLSMFSCFVIISGVLIWKEARNKPSYTEKQRRFHRRVTTVYLSICFSLLPATAVLFIAEQLLHGVAGRADIVNTVFFVSWLVLAAIGCFQKSEKQITWINLMVGGVLGCLVPIANGWATGDWIWSSLRSLPYVFITDVVWLMVGASAIVLSGMMRKTVK